MNKTAPKDKIIIVTNQFKNIKSGVGTVANALVNQLGEDYSILLICPESENKPAENVKVITVSPSKFDPTNHHWLSFARQSSKAVRQLNQAEYKLVIFMDAREGLFCNKISIPTLGIIHDFMSARFGKLSRELKRMYPDWFKRYVYYKIIKKLEERAYQRLDNLLTVCDYTKTQVLRDYKIKKPISVIWNGIDFTRLKSPSAAKQKNSVAFICGNPYLKGLPNLLQAIELVAKNEPDIKCYIIGKTDTMTKKLLSASPHAIFLGGLDYEAVMQRLDKCQVFCMPSLFESFSMSYLEALFYNMQVIASANTGTPEIAKYFDNLQIVDPKNVSQIAAAIEKALAEPKQPSSKNLQIISSTRMGDDYKKLIKRIINES